ncbi:MAG: UbiA family prenyltransferase, partial [Cyanobium sp. LacPavin_0920_WC12_MAG_62_9]|nr:UbiA family prenyltransferase [Cyanobium sp. LacPavin_0920_WC12_MAG_62_9]
CRDRVATWANGCLVLGLGLMALVAWRSSPAVLALVLACCGLGYLYQGPPFRLGYRGLGEPLCWLAFGPLATAAGLLALAPATIGGDQAAWAQIPWRQAIELGSGPALATTLVLFCSHFHQVHEDGAHGKRSPVVRLGTGTAARLVPWMIALTLAFEWAPVLAGHWPLTALLGVIGLPPGRALIARPTGPWPSAAAGCCAWKLPMAAGVGGRRCRSSRSRVCWLGRSKPCLLV